jgi:DNA-binding transcriptional LysR family regulator
LDIQFLSSLVKVVDSGSIAQAAREEGITAAAVGQRVRTLEQMIGCKLLRRNGNTAQPTEACLSMLDRARHLIREAEALIDDAAAPKVAGSLKLGIISTALTGLLPAILRRLKTQAPLVTPHIVPGSSLAIYEALEKNRISAGILVEPPFALPKHFTARIIEAQPLVLLSKSKPKGSIFRELKSKPYIQYDHLSWGGRLAQQYLRDKGLSLQPVFELDALEAIAILVSENVGVSLVPLWPGLDIRALNVTATFVRPEEYDRNIIFLRHAIPIRERLFQAVESAIFDEMDSNKR